MFIKLLGSDFIVWDKAARIRFRRPGRSTLYATFRLTVAEVQEVREAAMAQGKTEREFAVDLVDAAGVVHASATKTIHFQWRPATIASGAG